MKNNYAIFTLLLVFAAYFSYSQEKLTKLQEIKQFKHSTMQMEAGEDHFSGSFARKANQQKSSIMDYGDAPDLNWIEHFGGSGYDYVEDMILDDDLNVYMVGSFSGNMSVSSNAFESQGNRDGFVAKFDENGNFLWFTQFSAGAGETVSGYGLAIDADGNIFATGYYTGSIELGGNSLPDMNERNLFIAKLNTSGEVTAATYHSDTEFEAGLKIELDNDGNIYVVASTNTSTGWRHTTRLLKFSSGFDVLLTKDLFYSVSINDLIIDNTNIYFAGYVADYGEIDTIVLDPNGYGDAFVAQSDLDFNFGWITMGDHEQSYSGDSHGDHIAMDMNGNVYLAGGYRTNVSFGDILLDGEFDGGFLVQFNASGEPQWAQSLGNYVADLAYDDVNEEVVIAYANQMSTYANNGTEEMTQSYENNLSCLAEGSSAFIAGAVDGLIFLQQQDNSWMVNFTGDSGYGDLIGMVTDNAGNVYTFGYASSETEFLGETLSKGIFVSKQTGNGELVWLNSYQSGMAEFSSQGNYINIAKDLGYLYVTGPLREQLIIPGETTLTPDEETGSIFVIKFDLDGNYIWSIQEDYPGYDVSVVPDYSGNLILSDFFQGEIAVAGVSLTSAGSQDGYVAKYDENGDNEWVIRTGGEQTEYFTITTTDMDDNIYVSGEYLSATGMIGDTEFSLEEGDGNIILAKLNPTGDVLWIKSFAGSPVDGGDFSCWPTGIELGPDGNLYVKGWHGDSIYFDNVMLTSPYGYFSKFITKIDTDGNVVWAKSISENTYGFDYNQFDIDSSGNVVFGMYVRDTIRFEDEFTYVNEGYRDLAVFKFTTDGELDWVKTMSSNETGLSWISSVAVHGTENVFVAGYITEYLSVDNEEVAVLNRHGFVSMLGDDIVGLKEVYNRNAIQAYPNPTNGLLHITLEDQSNVQGIDLFDCIGKKIETYNPDSKNVALDISHLSAGIYILNIKQENVNNTIRILKE